PPYQAAAGAGRMGLLAVRRMVSSAAIARSPLPRATAARSTWNGCVKTVSTIAWIAIVSVSFFAAVARGRLYLQGVKAALTASIRATRLRRKIAVPASRTRGIAGSRGGATDGNRGLLPERRCALRGGSLSAGGRPRGREASGPRHRPRVLRGEGS